MEKKHEFIQWAEKVISIEKNALDDLIHALNEDFVKAVNFCKTSLDNKGKIVIIGVGKSGNIGHKISATLNSTGATSVVLNVQNALHGDLGLINDGDVIIALSYSGETAELLELLPYIQILDVRLIGITGKNQSTLSECAEVSIITPVKEEACPLGLAPTSSSTSALVAGDALAMALLQARGFTKDDFAKYHPAGSLGKSLLMTAKHLMRPITETAYGSGDLSVMDSIQMMGAKRTGSYIITSETGDLIGIFTHGDFIRNFEAIREIGEHKVSEFMTHDPICIVEDKKAMECINLFKENSIDDLIVVDKENKLLGVIDSTDIAKLKF